MTTPRVAESLDDLRVGMVVVAHNRVVHISDAQLVEVDERYLAAWSEYPSDVLTFYILSDPPPEPVRVPADLLDALAERMDAIYPSDYNGDPGSVVEAARAVVDTARNGTDQ